MGGEMSEILLTTKGMIPAADLVRTDGEVDSDNEHTTWTEWRDVTGEVVKRSVHVRLKKGQECSIAQEGLG